MIRLSSICTAGVLDRPSASNSKEPIKCISLNNQPSQGRPTLDDINCNETLFYRFTVSVNKCCGSCNAIDDPYAWVCVLNKVKNMNVKLFNLMPRVKLNETFSSKRFMWV